MTLLFGLLLLARGGVWIAYRKRLAGQTTKRAQAALDRAGNGLLIGGTAIPLALLLAAFVAAGSAALAALAGLLAALAGGYVKFALITRAGHNQGFALRELPVRGARPSGG